MEDLYYINKFPINNLRSNKYIYFPNQGAYVEEINTFIAKKNHSL